jgi:methyl coenzyme M reductase alpha subunit
VDAINPMQAARYRERHSTSGAKSDGGDAHVLAEAIKLVARAHQTLIWDRHRHLLRLRGALREFFPAALDAFDDLTAPTRWSSWAPLPTP